MKSLLQANFEHEEYWKKLFKECESISSRTLDMESILDLRNDILTKFPEETGILSDLEHRSIDMLWNFGKYSKQRV